MNAAPKHLTEMLAKLGISRLNPMQEAAHAAISAHSEVVLVSPTGTGKTLAFLLPLLPLFDPALAEVQALILTPSRELAQQIEQVFRSLGSGLKVNAVYGGRPIAKDKESLRTAPALLVGTPGRVADHLRRGTFAVDQVHTLVLDEFDKSLEVGFEEQMKEIVAALPRLSKKVLTSATEGVPIPAFVGLRHPEKLVFASEEEPRLSLWRIVSPEKDKLETLGRALCMLGTEPGIVFCNFRDSIQRISDYLSSVGIAHGCFYGDMEQMDRERALIRFRNGTHRLLLATDLAARGIDVPEIRFILHYQLPAKAHEFVHRNGRTARMHQHGAAFVLHWRGEDLPEYLEPMEEMPVTAAPVPPPSMWKTLYLSGGRKDKISKGDIAGLLQKQGGLAPDQLGLIEVKEEVAFVAVAASELKRLLPLVDNARLKTKKVRVTVLE